MLVNSWHAYKAKYGLNLIEFTNICIFKSRYPLSTLGVCSYDGITIK